jgi:hypothetical protein
MKSKAEIAAALKQVQSTRPTENFIVVQISYDKKILLPYKQGIAFLATLEHAEMLYEPYSKPKAIKGVEEDTFQSRVFSRQDYEDIKVSTLLNITLDELKAAREHVELEPETTP